MDTWREELGNRKDKKKSSLRKLVKAMQRNMDRSENSKFNNQS